MAELLRVQGLTSGYGEAVVIEDVGFSLEEGRSLALLGRNGTGKTTLLTTLVGVTRYRAGSIDQHRARCGHFSESRQCGVAKSAHRRGHYRLGTRVGPESV